MTRIHSKLLIFSLFALATQGINAQTNGVNSPYSRYGYGLLSDCSMGFNKSMAGISQGFRGSQEINIKNPASYSAVDSLTALFDVGMSVQLSTHELGGLRQNARNALFDYFAFHFRATKGLGMTAAILPVSRIGYSTTGNTETVKGSDDNEYTAYDSYAGEGGLRKVIIGAGYQLPFFRQFNLGFNVGYLWGEYEHAAKKIYNESTAFTNTTSYSASISTYCFDAGVQFSQSFGKNKKHNITVGASYTLGHDIKQDAVRKVALSSNSDPIETRLPNSLSLPHSYTAGITYKLGSKLRVGADFELQQWHNCRFPKFEDYVNYNASSYTPTTGALNDMYRYSLGGEYMPNFYSRNFLNRVAYKLGGYYSKSYANADEAGVSGKKPVEYGLTAGFTIPLTNKNLFHATPKVNISFAWIHSDAPTANNTTLKENYYRISVGLTISERWFYKWKVQ